jgi:hypothetical protein
MKLYTGNAEDTILDRQVADEPAALVESHLQALLDRLRHLTPGDPARAVVLLEVSRTLLRLDRQAQAWDPAKAAFQQFVQAQDWEAAVQACEALFLSEQPGSLAALGQGVWLAVTFPVPPDLSVEMLRHIVEETPEDSDGAAVAAATAHYVADLRAQGQQRENLLFYTAQMLSSVARRHSAVPDQAAFDAWMDRLELREPEKFLVRLRNVLDILVQDDWWVDRDALHSDLPVN